MSKQIISMWPRLPADGPGAEPEVSLMERAIAVIFSALVLTVPAYALWVLAAHQPALPLG